MDKRGHLSHGLISRDEYKRTMLNSNGWGTAVEIKAACLLFNINITVFLRCIRYADNAGRLKNTHFKQPCTHAGASHHVELLLCGNHYSVLFNERNVTVSTPINATSVKTQTLHASTSSAETSVKPKNKIIKKIKKKTPAPKKDQISIRVKQILMCENKESHLKLSNLLINQPRNLEKVFKAIQTDIRNKTSLKNP